MPQTVEVRFKGTRRDFFLWPDDQEPLRLREAVVVELDRGQDLGRVHTAGEVAEKKCGGGCTSCAVGEGIAESRTGGVAIEETDAADKADELNEEQPALPSEELSALSASEESSTPPAPPAPPASTLRAILRRATQDDIRVSNELRVSEDNIRRQVLEKVRQHKLEMKVSDAEWQWDRAKLSVYFTAEKRVDFRALVRDLASLFRTRIELRQIGVRDEAARLTGVGRCGREYCCSSWLKDLSPISLALAKDQHLSLNPAQISGGCGRLLCCLKYEHEFYVASRRRFPREGKALDTSMGKEKVIAVDIFRERVFLRSDEHGPRIIPLVQLKEEMETAAAAGPATTMVAETVERRSPPGSSPQQKREPDRRGPGPERRQRPERSAAAARPPEARPAAVSAPPPATPPAAEKPAAPPAPSEGQVRSRRRRRGRRGRGGQGGGSTPGSSPAPEA